jgi:flagellar assembly factor FliW
MLIHSAVFGEMEVEASQVYKVPGGLYGFEDFDEYALITRQEDDVPLMWFQATQSQVPCFVVFDPYDIATGFEPEMEPADLRFLAAQSTKNLRFLVLAVVPEDVTKATVNMKSPLAINEKEGIVRQVILRNDYPIRFPLADDTPEEPEDDSSEAAQ